MWVQLSHVELVSPPTGKYRPTLQMGMLGLNEIKGLCWRSELEVGRIGAWIQIWDGLSQPSTCTLGERRKTMTWWGKKAAQMKLNFFFFFFYLNKRFNVFILHSRIPISLFLLIFIFLLYNTVFVLPYIDMNPPQVYMRSQTWTPLPPPSP